MVAIEVSVFGFYLIRPLREIVFETFNELGLFELQALVHHIKKSANQWEVTAAGK